MMDEKRIIELIQERLDELSEEKAGGSGHMSNIGYGNPKILVKKGTWINFKCEVWVQSEFMVVEEDNEYEFNPYHDLKNGEREIIDV